MAHIAKYKKFALGHMLNHYARSEDIEKAVVRSNDNIDASRTHLNYNLAEHQQLIQLDFVHKRLSEIRVQNRKDINVMLDWVVTLPKLLNSDEQEKFFRETYNFLNERYGKENVISAYVHLDEITPHMHYSFIPVVEDKKRGGYKLSAKEKITKNDLKSFHFDLSKYLENLFGRDVGILNEVTKYGNKEIAELKRESIYENILNAKNDLLFTRDELFKVRGDISIASDELSALKLKLEHLRRDILTAKKVKSISHTNSFLGLGKDVVISQKDFNALRKTATLAEELLKEIDEAREIKASSEKIVDDAEKTAIKIIRNAKKQEDMMRKKSLNEVFQESKSRKELDEINKILRSNPLLLETFRETQKSFYKNQNLGKDWER